MLSQNENLKRNYLEGLYSGILIRDIVSRFQIRDAGSVDNCEIDFIAEKPGEKIYVQVSMSILDENTKERELRPLNLINDNYPKYVLTLDDYDLSENGIMHRNIIDFLLRIL